MNNVNIADFFYLINLDIDIYNNNIFFNKNLYYFYIYDYY